LTSSRISGPVRLAVAGLVLAVGMIAGLASDTAVAATPPKLTVSPASAAVGQTVQVTVTGLSPNGTYELQVCGQNAVHDSADCAAADTVTTVAGSTGTLSMPLAVVVPPTPCPCVVASFDANSLTGPVTAPITIEGASSSSAPITLPQTPAPNIVVVNAKMQGSPPFGAWFGLPVTRTLALTLRNAGTLPASSINLFASLGSTPLVSRQLPELGVGQQQTYMVPVKLPALSVGSLSITGQVARGNGQLESFKASSPLWPWGLFIIAFLIVQLILFRVRNVMRRRHERKQPPAPPNADPEGPMFRGEVVRHGG
jgi:neocarzinostatin family protein